MHVVDSREAKGPGILLLQDFRPIAPDVRGAILAVRVINRDEFGVYEVEDNTYGDLLCASVWPTKGGGTGALLAGDSASRPMPAWSWAWSVLATGGKANAPYTGPGAEGGSPTPIQPPGRGEGAQPSAEVVSGSAPTEMLPAWKKERTADSRFAPQPLALPDAWPSFPNGFGGIAVAGTDEGEQNLHYHPTDPRLVSPHRGLPELSSIVTDCKGADPDLAARLAHHLFVLNAPSVDADDKTAKASVGAPALGRSDTKPVAKDDTPHRLAWLIGHSNGFQGGFVIDNEPRGGAQGGGTFSGPNSYSNDPKHTGPGQEIPRTTGGGSPGPGIQLSPFQPNLPQGAGNLARSLLLQQMAQKSANALGVPVSVTDLGGGVGPLVPPKAKSLAALGIKVGGRQGASRIVALVSANYGGYLHTGTADDAHRLGTDADGNPINPGHIAIDALFYADKERDGPLAWWHEWRRVSSEFEHRAPVTMGFDGEIGRWSWWCQVPFDRVYNAQPNVPGGRPAYEGPGSGGPGTPLKPPEGIIGGPGDARTYIATHSEAGFAVILGRPQSQVVGAPDLRVNWAEDEQIEEARRAPITARIEAWGPQTDEWVRTQAENVLYRGGTASGGLLVLPPEGRLEETAPDGYTLSTTYFAIGSGARLGFGTPVRATGALGSGWAIMLSGASLLFSDTSSAGAVNNGISLVGDGAGGYALKTLTNAKGIKLQDVGGNTLVETLAPNKLGLFGATPVTKPTVTGARNDPEGALKDLLAKLATTGIITDSTTAS